MSLLRLSLLAGLACAALLAPVLVRGARGAEERRAAAAAEPVAERFVPLRALQATALQPAADPISGARPEVADPLAASRTPVALPAPDPSRVEVLVVDAAGRPAAGVPVAVWGPVERLMHSSRRGPPAFPLDELPEARGSTGKDGLAVLLLDPGEWIVSLDRELDQAVASMEIAAVGARGAARVSIRLRELSLDLLRPKLPETMILGMVVDQQAEPVGGAEVLAERSGGRSRSAYSQGSGLFLITGLEPREECLLASHLVGYDDSAQVSARGGDGLVSLRQRRSPGVVLHIFGADGEPYQGPATVVPERAGVLPERQVQGPDAEVFYLVDGDYRLRVQVDPDYLSRAFTARRGDELAVQLEPAGILAAAPDARPPRGAIVVRGQGSYQRRVFWHQLEDGIAVPPGVVEVELPGKRQTLTLHVQAGDRTMLEPSAVRGGHDNPGGAR